MKREYYDEMRCRGCGKRMDEDTPLHDTGWSGVHWCGADECAVKIMKDTCEEMDPDDECYFDLEEDGDYEDPDPFEELTDEDVGMLGLGTPEATA